MNPVKELMASWAQRRQEAAETKERRRKEAAETAERRERFESRHRLRLDNAAGVSSMQITCHEDTWKFVQETVFPRIRYNIAYHGWIETESFPDDRVKRGTAGMVTVSLSGRHLVRCLTIFRAILGVGTDHHTSDAQQYAMSNRLYDLMSKVVDEIDPSSSTGSIPRLVIDAGLEETKPED